MLNSNFYIYKFSITLTLPLTWVLLSAIAQIDHLVNEKKKFMAFYLGRLQLAVNQTKPKVNKDMKFVIQTENDREYIKILTPPWRQPVNSSFHNIIKTFPETGSIANLPLSGCLKATSGTRWQHDWAWGRERSMRKWPRASAILHEVMCKTFVCKQIESM